MQINPNPKVVFTVNEVIKALHEHDPKRFEPFGSREDANWELATTLYGNIGVLEIELLGRSDVGA